jgi:S-adenosylhomocysteine hydrolase
VAFKVKDISSSLGKEIELAEAEMPGLMALVLNKDDDNHLLVLVLQDAHDNPNCSFNRDFNCSWC